MADDSPWIFIVQLVFIYLHDLQLLDDISIDSIVIDALVKWALFCDNLELTDLDVEDF